jgi:hypothetical protein
MGLFLRAHNTIKKRLQPFLVDWIERCTVIVHFATAVFDQMPRPETYRSDRTIGGRNHRASGSHGHIPQSMKRTDVRPGPEDDQRTAVG